MNYTENLTLVKKYFPYDDLIAENSFSLFDNEDFALKTFNYISEAIDNINSKFSFKTHFAYRFNINFNAKAWKQKNVNIILLNHALVNDLEPIIKKSVNYFLQENFTKTFNFEIKEEVLIELFFYVTTSYLLFHELGHILQFNSTNKKEANGELNENNSHDSNYLEKNHVYEIDADLFGISVGAVLIIQYLQNNKIDKNLSLLTNLIIIFVLIISNTFIKFSNKFETLYYKQTAYPHPIIRTRFCIEQILNIVNENVKIEDKYFKVIENNYLILLSKMQKSEIINFDYLSLLELNEKDIEKYMSEIEKINENYPELTRHNAQNIFDLIGI